MNQEGKNFGLEGLNKFLGELVDEVRRQSEVIEPWHSFWRHRPHLDFPPKTIRDLSEYDGSERLSLACTQTNLPAKQQKELVQSWCQRLPQLAGVRFLWLQSRATQELFDAACAMPDLEGLNIKWGAILSSAMLAGSRKLKYLHLGSPSLAPLEVLGELPELVWLELDNIKAAADLSFLEKLPNLTGLSITGDSNSIKVLPIQTLAPLRALKKLEWLQLATVTVADESLAPIAELPALRYLNLANRFRMEEVAALAARLPQVKCELFRPTGEVVNWTLCKKCKQKTMVMLTGKGLPWLCTACDAKRLQKHEEAFRRISGQA